MRLDIPNGRDSDPLHSELEAVREFYLAGFMDRAGGDFLGLIELKRGKPDRAVKWLSLAAKSHPRFAQAHQNLAVALLRMDKCAAAAEHGRHAVKFAPTAFLIERRKFDEALLHIDRALSLAPDDTGFQLTRAQILFRKGNIAVSAAAYAKEILASHPAVVGAGELPDIPRIAESGHAPRT